MQTPITFYLYYDYYIFRKNYNRMFSILRKTCLFLRIKKRNSYSNSSQQQCIEAIKKKKKIENGKK